MAGEAYVVKGTPLLISGVAGANYAWSVEGLVNAAGRTSAQIDLGVAPRPANFHWSCKVQWQATPVAGRGISLYIATAPDDASTQIDGNVGVSDAALSTLLRRVNLRYIGSVLSYDAVASVDCIQSGTFECTERYLSLVAVNNAGSAVDATDSNFVFKLTPIYWQGQ